MNIFKNKYDIRDLRKFIQQHNDSIKSNVYKRYKVLIIDDRIDEDNYEFKDEILFLKNQCGCNITTKTDLDNLADAAAYDIIICDNDGVALKLNPSPSKDNGGVWLIRQLKREYKDKTYVLFSNQLINLKSLKKLEIDLWDKSELLRNTDNYEGSFSDNVRKALESFADPARSWEKIRIKLLKSNVSIHSVAKLESAYVKSIIKGNLSFYSDTSKSIDLNDIQEFDADKLIQTACSIISTTISIIGIL